jgi:hypothetical protein
LSRALNLVLDLPAAARAPLAAGEDRDRSSAGPGSPARAARSAPPAPAAPPALDERASRLVALALLLAGALLRALYVIHHRVNSDEPQHLHVAWGWTQGLLPYRDLFDNHSPLFSLAMAPLLGRVGERADVVIVMRLAMVPLVLTAMAATWAMARRLFGATAAWWAAAAAAIFPDYLRASVEYRSDQLWSALWLVSLATLLGGPLSVARCFATGLLMGATLATSMKTVAMGAGLVAALIAVALTSGWRRPVGWLAARLVASAAGAALVPGALVAWFAARGVLAPLLYQTVTHNVVSGLGLWSTMPWRAWLFVHCVPLLVWLAGRLRRAAPDPATGRRRAVLLLAAGLYWATVETLWPLVTRQDYLPVFPVIALMLAAGAQALGARAARGARGEAMRRMLAIGPPAALVIVSAAIVVTWEKPWPDLTASQRSQLGEVLRLTRPGERVMDFKGESIFRPRPSPLVMEEITLERIANGEMADDIPARMRATATPVARTDLGLFPETTRSFIAAHYLPVGAWRVAGLRIGPTAGSAPTRRFDLEIAGRYAAITPRGPARGRLDGAPAGTPRLLAVGPHEYDAAPGEGTVYLVWAAALERGFTPLDHADLREERR